MIEVRRTVESDAEALRTIRLAALRADPTAFSITYDEAQTYGSELWRERAVGSDISATFFAFRGTEPVGMVAGVELAEAPDRVELVSMWTDPAARGLGVGQRLVGCVAEWARDRGTPEVRLWVTRGNEAAVRLYERCGFVLTDETIVSPADPCREEIRMRLR